MATSKNQKRLPQHRPTVKEQSITLIKAHMPRLMVAIANPPTKLHVQLLDPT